MKLEFLLDTNICIYIAKEKPASVLQKFEKMAQGQVAMSVVTYGELLYGANKSQHPKKAKSLLDELSNLIPPLPLSIDVGEHYGLIRSTLEKKGKPIGNNDLWIAAHALAAKLTLVTNNMKGFSRISHLKTENWV